MSAVDQIIESMGVHPAVTKMTEDLKHFADSLTIEQLNAMPVPPEVKSPLGAGYKLPPLPVDPGIERHRELVAALGRIEGHLGQISFKLGAMRSGGN